MTTPNTLDLTGISGSTLQFNLNSGPILKVTSGNFEITNAAGTADVSLTALTLNLSGTVGQIVLNAAATESGASWKTVIQNATSGQTIDWTLSLPPTAGSPGQVLQTDGSGNSTWASAASTTACLTYVTHTIHFNDTSPEAFFTLPANATVREIDINVTTVWNGTSPSISLGVSGTPSKFMPSTNVDLTVVGGYTTTACKYLATVGTTQALIITFAPGTGGTTGVAIVTLAYTVPNAV